MQESAEVRHGGSEFNVKVMKQEVVVMEPTGGGSSVIIPPLACLFAKSRSVRETCPATTSLCLSIQMEHQGALLYPCTF